MRTRSAARSIGVCLLLALGAALALAACGGTGETAAATTTSGPPQEGKVLSEHSTQPPPVENPAVTCRNQLGTFVVGMDRLRANLVAGLDYEGYVDEVKRIRRAYDAIPVDRLALTCLRAAGTPGEKALNRYIVAGNTWTDCVEADGCEAATIESTLRSKWEQASRYLSKAQHGLRDPSGG